MSFADRLDAEIQEHSRRGVRKAWSLSASVVAAFCAVGSIFIAANAVNQEIGFISLVVLLWATGATIGTTSLIMFGVLSSPSAKQRVNGIIGLWIGNLTACATIIVGPILTAIAAVPIIGGFVVLIYLKHRWAPVYATIPLVVVGTMVLLWIIEITTSAT